MNRLCLAVCIVALGSICHAAVVRTIPTMTNDIIYDPGTATIFASVPSIAPDASGNSIKPINPVAGTVGTGVWVGSEPTVLARSGDGQYLYVGLEGAGAVRRYHIPTATPGLQFSLGVDSYNGPKYARDIEVMPGNPNTVAIAAYYGGVAIYDSGVARPTIVSGSSSYYDYLTWSDSPSTLYGHNTGYSSDGFRTMAVGSNGVTIATKHGGITNSSTDIVFADGRLYSTNGRVMDPTTHTLLGTYAATGPLAVDADHNRVYFLKRDTSYYDNYSLIAFDLEKFVPVGSLSLGTISPTPSDLIRWGSNGLAFRTDEAVYLVNWAEVVVPEPATILLLALSGGLLVRRRAAA